MMPGLLKTPIQAARLITPSIALSGKPSSSIDSLQVHHPPGVKSPSLTNDPLNSSSAVLPSLPTLIPTINTSLPSAKENPDCPLLALPTDIVFEILDKIPAADLACSNPFPP
ncbi:hypothetical protein MRB53_022708 [Persea americana]|uniref:Uncharacterized protein n=1 Tax=Persea americana TaxID=3435 RepID=A0ACC2L7I3_PERAE|nr:hypothetical protein MRB53_022708 [Persea americana]